MHGGWKCNFSHSKGQGFKNFPGEHIPGPPRESKEIFLLLCGPQKFICHHILKCHTYMFEKVGKDLTAPTELPLKKLPVTNSACAFTIKLFTGWYFFH